MSVGMPRPSSSTWTEPSAWMITDTWVAWPATPSSVALSMISLARWLTPRLSVEPMYMPGRFRTASSPSRCVRSSAPYRISAVTRWHFPSALVVKTRREYRDGPTALGAEPMAAPEDARLYGQKLRFVTYDTAPGATRLPVRRVPGRVAAPALATGPAVPACRPPAPAASPDTRSTRRSPSGWRRRPPRCHGVRTPAGAPRC